MKFFVIYSLGFGDCVDEGVVELENTWAVEKFIEDKIQKGCPAGSIEPPTLKNFRVIKGVEVNTEATVMVSKVKLVE